MLQELCLGICCGCGWVGSLHILFLNLQGYVWGIAQSFLADPSLWWFVIVCVCGIVSGCLKLAQPDNTMFESLSSFTYSSTLRVDRHFHLRLVMIWWSFATPCKAMRKSSRLYKKQPLETAWFFFCSNSRDDFNHICIIAYWSWYGAVVLVWLQHSGLQGMKLAAGGRKGYRNLQLPSSTSYTDIKDIKEHFMEPTVRYCMIQSLLPFPHRFTESVFRSAAAVTRGKASINIIEWSQQRMGWVRWGCSSGASSRRGSTWGWHDLSIGEDH